ncbi:MAG: homoserine dehydrogenase [Myxococcota bacterium]|nr:homoserine dehydrogenase [Myxococcota bacterium]
MKMAERSRGAAGAPSKKAVKKSVRVGLLGLGTVGAGVAEILKKHQSMIDQRVGMEIDVVRALVRSKKKKRSGVARGVEQTTKPSDIVGAPDIDVVVELMGGIEPARTMVLDSLMAGQSVVTANKALVALHGTELFRAAKKSGADIHFEAAVAGGIPIIRTLREALASDRITRVMGILNGTTNYILGQMAKGNSYEDALGKAQELGYAEADPTLDVNGRDAADKIAILSRLAFGTSFKAGAIEVQGIERLTPAVLADAKSLGYRVKLIAQSWLAKHGDQEVVHAGVFPCFVPIGHELSAVPGAQNAILVQSDSLGTTLYQGPGAGGLPTGSAVTADIMEAARNIRAGVRRQLTPASVTRAPKLKNLGQCSSRFYARWLVRDEPGVLAAISKVLANNGISLATVLQSGGGESDSPVGIVFTTHETTNAQMNKAMNQIKRLRSLKGGGNVLRILGNKE